MSSLPYKPDKRIHPGKSLEEALLMRAIQHLAEEIGEPSHKIEEIVDRYQPITPEMSLKLEKALRIPASFWNNLQKQYERGEGE